MAETLVVHGAPGSPPGRARREFGNRPRRLYLYGPKGSTVGPTRRTVRGQPRREVPDEVRGEPRRGARERSDGVPGTESFGHHTAGSGVVPQDTRVGAHGGWRTTWSVGAALRDSAAAQGGPWGSRDEFEPRLRADRPGVLVADLARPETERPPTPRTGPVLPSPLDGSRADACPPTCHPEPGGLRGHAHPT